MAEEVTTSSEKVSFQNKFLTKKNIKTAVIALVILIIALSAYFLKGEVVAALVNGQPVSRMKIVSSLEKQGGKQALDTEITKTLIRQEAKKQGIKVEQEELDAKINEISINLSAQGMTLEQALVEQGLTRQDLYTELSIQVEVEKLMGESVDVTDAEVEEFITQNELKKEDVTADTREQIKSQIQQQKRSGDVDALIMRLRKEANIQYFKNY